MEKYHILLVNATRNKTVGNHRVEIDDNIKRFYYHGNNVCTANTTAKTFSLDGCGWSNKISTKRCLKGYSQYFTSQGYREINQEEK